MLKLKDLSIVESKDELMNITEGKALINTINANSYNVAQKDRMFAESLAGCDYLIPDGASIVKACRWLKAKSQPMERIAGWDLFFFEMNRLNAKGMKASAKKTVLFVGSSPRVLSLITERAAIDFPYLKIATYSPPYKEEFDSDDDLEMINAINMAYPDLVWIGMTAPKQEKWAYRHWSALAIKCHVGTIGAVFDFYAGTVQRAPQWWQDHSLEWLYRLLKEPKRMWRRYVIGNPLFLLNIIKEKLSNCYEDY